MGYYTVDLNNQTDDNHLLTEYLLHKQSIKLEDSFESGNDIIIEQGGAKDKRCRCKEEKKETMHRHYGELTKKFIVIIKIILVEYTDMPVRDLEKEMITEIVDKVIEHAKSEIEELDEIISEKSHYPFGRYYLLRQIIEILLLNELF